MSLLKNDYIEVQLVKHRGKPKGVGKEVRRVFEKNQGPVSVLNDVLNIGDEYGDEPWQWGRLFRRIENKRCSSGLNDGTLLARIAHKS